MVIFYTNKLNGESFFPKKNALWGAVLISVETGCQISIGNSSNGWTVAKCLLDTKAIDELTYQSLVVNLDKVAK